MFVGEQPGDREDLEGHPFVGPAGRVLDEALAQAGIAREAVYLTNVVKHFRYEARGKRRIHQKPDRWHVSACLPWLEAEVTMVKPDALVLLGAVAGQALLGSGLRVTRDRGKPMPCDLAELVTVTTHPSAILRMRGAQERAQAMKAFVADLRAVADWLSAALTAPTRLASKIPARREASAMMVSAGLAEPWVGMTLPSAMNRLGTSQTR